MDDASRCRLAREVFNAVFERCETFRENHLGSDLAYLLGAILDSEKGSYVDWSEGVVHPNTVRHFQALFPPAHKVWHFIQP